MSERLAKPINQCDGCRRGLPVLAGFHRGPKGFWGGDIQACTAEHYQPETAPEVTTDGHIRWTTRQLMWARLNNLVKRK